MSTQMINASNRLVRFSNVDLSGVTALFSLTAGSYYRILIKESSSTNIIEILNDVIYSVCTYGEKKIQLVENILYVSSFEKNCDVIIEFFEEFEFCPTIEEGLTDEDETKMQLYSTGGVINYLANLRAENFSAQRILVSDVNPATLKCNNINIGNWTFSKTENNNILVSVTKTK